MLECHTLHSHQLNFVYIYLKNIQTVCVFKQITVQKKKNQKILFKTWLGLLIRPIHLLGSSTSLFFLNPKVLL